MVSITAPTPEQWDELRAVDARAFGIGAVPEDAEHQRAMFELDRLRVAMDGSTIVGVAGSYAMELTVPGPRQVPMAGVTWVGVESTHRRSGVARRLLEAVHEDSRLRGESVQGLWASEAGIYGRFGYSPATRRRSVVVDRRGLGRLDTRRGDDGRELRVLTGPARQDHLAATWQRWAHARSGEVSRSDAWWHRELARWDRNPSDSAPAVTVGCRDGYVVYRITPRWDVPSGSGRPGHRLEVIEFVSVDPPARRALWAHLLDMDLVAEIHLGDLLDEDPMPLMIDDARRVHTQGILDGLWLRVLDPVVALGSRRYATVDRLVVAVGERRFHLETTPDAVHCEELASQGHDSVDIDIDPVLLGAWLIGPVDLPRWLAAGQIRVRDAAMRDRLAALVASVRPPVCTTHF